MLRPKHFVMFTAMASFAGMITFGAEPANRNPEEKAIRSAAEQYLAALERRDAQALLAFWVPEGRIIDERGTARPAREVIAEETKGAANGPRRAVKLVSSSFRFLSPDVAEEDGTVEAAQASGSPAQGRFTAIWLKQKGKWLLSSIREARISPATQQNHLRDLDWLVGNWTARHDNAELDISAYWDASHKFLMRNLKVFKDGKLAMTGTQRIGWDPATHTIKGWIFDSSGGQGESTWTRQGDSWTVHATATLSDGAHSTSNNVYTPNGKDSFKWKSAGSKASNGQAMPNFEIEVQRRSTTSAVAKNSGSAAERKAKILEGSRWRRAMFEMDEWLSAQPLYKPQQVAEVKTSLEKRVASMSVDELEFMLADMEAKFKIIDTPEAVDARAWLAQYLSVLSTKRREEVLKNTPDLLSMTAGQIQQELGQVEAQRRVLQQESALQQSKPTPTNPFGGDANRAALDAYTRDHSTLAGPSYSPYRSGTAGGERPFADAQIGPSTQFYTTSSGGFGMFFSPSSW